jgi:hypothetical protein
MPVVISSDFFAVKSAHDFRNFGTPQEKAKAPKASTSSKEANACEIDACSNFAQSAASGATFCRKKYSAEGVMGT